MEVVREENGGLKLNLDFTKEVKEAEDAETHIQKVIDGFDAEIKKATLKALNDKGFYFANDAEFMEFAKKRLTNATVEDVPFMNIVYLDFVDFDNLGTFLFAYRNELKTSFENGILTTSIG